jgi:hypothetical protein
MPYAGSKRQLLARTGYVHHVSELADMSPVDAAMS